MNHRIRAAVRLAAPATLALGLAGCGGHSAAPSAKHTATAKHCTTSEVAVWIGVGVGGGAAGSVYYPLEFSNVSHHRCQLFGFPGVSARTSRQLGSPAARNRTRPASRVTLSPGETAHATLQIIDVFNLPRRRCRPTSASDLRVYPPNERSAFDVPFSFEACSIKGETFLSVQPVQPRVGVPGYPRL